MPLTVQARVEKRLQITFSNQPDPVVDELILQVDSLLNQMVGYNFEQTTLTETFSGGGLKNRWVTKAPIVSVTSVTEDGVALTVDDTFVVDADVGIIYRMYSGAEFQRDWLKGFRNVVVVYEGGFATVPIAVQTVATEMVARMFDDGAVFAAVANADTGFPAGVTTREVIGEYEVSLRDDKLRNPVDYMSKENRQTIAGYRRRAFA